MEGVALGKAAANPEMQKGFGIIKVKSHERQDRHRESLKQRSGALNGLLMQYQV